MASLFIYVISRTTDASFVSRILKSVSHFAVCEFFYNSPCQPNAFYVQRSGLWDIWICRLVKDCDLVFVAY